MLIDELFNEYRQKHGKDPGLLDRLAREAQQFCMTAVYWNRRRGFYRRISQDEALTVFHDLFLECVEKGPEGEIETLSRYLCYVFPRRLISHIKRTNRQRQREFLIPDEDRTVEDLADNKPEERSGSFRAKPDNNALLKERIKLLLDSLEQFSKRELDMFILNALGLSRDDIVDVLDVERQKVNKGKHDSYKKATKILRQDE